MAVYFVLAKDVNRVKIGTSDSPERRIEALYLQSPVPIELLGQIPGGFKEERNIHDRFAHLRRHGEWFEYSPDLKQFIWLEVMLAFWKSGPQEWRDEFLRRAEI